MRTGSELPSAPDDLDLVARLHRELPPSARVMASGRTRLAAVMAERQRRSFRTAYFIVAATAAAAIVAAAVVGLGGQAKPPASSSNGPGLGFRPGPSQGVARNATELVDFAARSAAKAPVFVPAARDWEYIHMLSKGPYMGPAGYQSKSWQQVGFGRTATLMHGRLSYGRGGGKGAQLQGWPGNTTDLYRYLASLPARPGALRRVILANNHLNPSAAFNAIMNLMNDFPLPPRFQAELYAVLAGLPGTRFDPSATDAAGRTGIGLYMIENGFMKEEIIINPRTYLYMGLLWIAVKAHTEHGTNPAVVHLHKGSIEGWNAMLGSGIVSRAGQLPLWRAGAREANRGSPKRGDNAGKAGLAGPRPPLPEGDSSAHGRREREPRYALAASG